MRKITGEQRPQAVEERVEYGQRIYGINVLIEEVSEGYEWCHIELPCGEWGYDVIVDALVRMKYPNDKMQAVVNNYLMDKEDKDIVAEFNEMQDWRKESKKIAKQLLEEDKTEKEEEDRK